jgi:hypothetical protein
MQMMVVQLGLYVKAIATTVLGMHKHLHGHCYVCMQWHACMCHS